MGGWRTVAGVVESRMRTNVSGGYNGAIVLKPSDIWLIAMDRSYCNPKSGPVGRVGSKVKSMDVISSFEMGS